MGACLSIITPHISSPYLSDKLAHGAAASGPWVVKLLRQFTLHPYILHSWEIIYFQTHVFKALFHSLKGCPEGHSVYHFAETATPLPPGCMLSLIFMDSLTLTGRSFLGWTWKYVHYYINKPYTHISYQHPWRPRPRPASPAPAAGTSHSVPTKVIPEYMLKKKTQELGFSPGNGGTCL